METPLTAIEQMKILKKKLERGTPITIPWDVVPDLDIHDEKIYLRVLLVDGGLVTSVTPRGTRVTSGLSCISLMTKRKDLKKLQEMEEDAQRRGIPLYGGAVPCGREALSYEEVEKNLLGLVQRAVEEDS